MCDDLRTDSHFFAVGAEIPAAPASSSYTTGFEVCAARDTLSVPYGAICSVVSHGHNVELHLSDKMTIKSTSTFRSLSDILTKDPRFLPCNRGILVNMNHVLALDGDLLRMKDGSTFPIRVNGRGAVISQFSQFMLRVMESGGRT